MRTERILLLTLLFVPAIGAAKDSTEEELRFTLPREFYAVAGIPMSIYFDNVVLTQTPEKYRFEVACEIGQVDARRWSVIAADRDVGEHPLSIQVFNTAGNQLAQAATTLRVIPANVRNRGKLRLLLVGDSLTHATIYPNALAELLARPTNSKWEMLGTHKPKSAASGVRHEGYGGWTWQRFATKYEPHPDGTYRKRISPFIHFVDGKPQLDVARYFLESCNDQRPDYVIFMLGINDCFSAPSDDPDARIDAMFQQADVLLTAFRRAAPDAQLGICLTTPPNSRPGAFQANYQDRYPRWGWKRIQHRLVQRQIARYGNQPQTNMFVIPTQLNLDPVNGYPDNNAVHPNAIGYQQISECIYAWLQWRLSSRHTE